MELTEKVAYIKGLCEGANLDLTGSAEGKVLAMILDVLEDMANEVEDLNGEVTELYDVTDELTEVVEDLDDEVEDMSGAWDELVEGLDDLADIIDANLDAEEDEDDYDEDDEDWDEYDEDDFDEDDFDDDMTYEIECPTCNNIIVVEDDILDAGEMVCPCCGEALEFDFSDLTMDAFEPEEDGDEE